MGFGHLEGATSSRSCRSIIILASKNIEVVTLKPLGALGFLVISKPTASVFLDCWRSKTQADQDPPQVAADFLRDDVMLPRCAESFA